VTRHPRIRLSPARQDNVGDRRATQRDRRAAVQRRRCAPRAPE